jgi:hypothetical protein
MILVFIEFPTFLDNQRNAGVYTEAADGIFRVEGSIELANPLFHALESDAFLDILGTLPVIGNAYDDFRAPIIWGDPKIDLYLGRFTVAKSVRQTFLDHSVQGLVDLTPEPPRKIAVVYGYLDSRRLRKNRYQPVYRLQPPGRFVLHVPQFPQRLPGLFYRVLRLRYYHAEHVGYLCLIGADLVGDRFGEHDDIDEAMHRSIMYVPGDPCPFLMGGFQAGGGGVVLKVYIGVDQLRYGLVQSLIHPDLTIKVPDDCAKDIRRYPRDNRDRDQGENIGGWDRGQR